MLSRFPEGTRVMEGILLGVMFTIPTDQNTSKARCHKITVKILDNSNIFPHCDQINRHQHRESGWVPLVYLHYDRDL